ncbi:hypothetical protein RRG08_047532 [Elysia crispata]|uniref:Uncharacterized protein n=1 Tax=Elysia crispata TaxID=231223 RepID=A0AAE1D2S5_9GAST|nr:hypothetical protein RRG08_047532 [Elysia crispata]
METRCSDCWLTSLREISWRIDAVPTQQRAQHWGVQNDCNCATTGRPTGTPLIKSERLNQLNTGPPLYPELTECCYDLSI